MKKLLSTMSLSKLKLSVLNQKTFKITNNILQNFATKKILPKNEVVSPKKKLAPKQKAKEIVEENEDEEEEVIIKPVPKKNMKKIVPQNKTTSAKKGKKVVNEEVEEEVEEEAEEVEEKVEIITKPFAKKNVTKPETSPQIKKHEAKVSNKEKNIPLLDDVINEFRSSTFDADITKNPEYLGKIPLDHDVSMETFPLSKKEDADPYDNYTSSNRVSSKVRDLISYEKDILCNNYAPLPIVIKKGRGAILEDVDGVKYVDCLSGYGAINFGHSHPYIISMILKQLTTLNLTSRALYTTVHCQAASLCREIFGYEKVLFMNSGVEGCEAAVKLARRYAYRVKKIPENKAKIVYMSGNFWGRSITACGTSDDPLRYTHYGPYDNHHYIVPYGDIDKLTEVLNSDENICAVMAESIQGEAGFIIPDSNFIKAIRNLTRSKNILYIDDEVQAGMGRSGKKLAYEWHLEADKPDIVVLAKALSSGSYPVSAVLTSKSIMDLIGPGEHGGTFTGNPLGMASVIASLNYFKKENYNVVQNCNFVGIYLSHLLFKTNFKWLKEVRGRGMLIGLEFHDNIPISTPDLCLLLMEKGLITKNSHKYNLRVAPPININLNTATYIYEIFNSVFKNLERQYPNYIQPSPTTYNVAKDEEIIKKAEEYLKIRFENPIKYKKYSEVQKSFIEIAKPTSNVIQTTNKNNNNNVFLGNSDESLLHSF